MFPSLHLKFVSHFILDLCWSNAMGFPILLFCSFHCVSMASLSSLAANWQWLPCSLSKSRWWTQTPGLWWPTLDALFWTKSFSTRRRLRTLYPSVFDLTHASFNLTHMMDQWLFLIKVQSSSHPTLSLHFTRSHEWVSPNTILLTTKWEATMGRKEESPSCSTVQPSGIPTGSAHESRPHSAHNL